MGVQMKSLLLVLVKSHNLVFSAEEPILAEVKLSNKNKKLQLIFLCFSKEASKTKLKKLSKTKIK